MQFLVYSSGYNCAKEAVACLRSVERQTYRNFTHIVVDDGSTDDTYDQLVRNQYLQTELYRNTTNLKWLHSATKRLLPKNEVVIVLLDLDDELYDENVLERIAREYRETNCWITYGNYVSIADKNVLSSQCKPLPQHVLDNRDFRKFAAAEGFFCGHVQTFRGFLWNNLNFDTLMYKGDYPVMSADSGIMMAMLEMCKPNKIRFINEKLYIYNNCRSLNDHNIDSKLQWWISQCYYKQPKYSVLNIYD